MAEPHTARDAELAFLALLLRDPRARSTADADFDQEERNNFLQALRNYYRASAEEIGEVAARIPALDEFPLVFHLSRHAGADVASVLRLRSEGLSWTGIGCQLLIDRDSFYVPLGSPMTLTPGRPYQYYARSARAAWSASAFSDADLVNLVNLKFISDYYHCRPEHVIALHSTGWTFGDIHWALKSWSGRSPGTGRFPAQRRPRSPAH